MTVGEIRDLLTKRLSKYIENVQLDVRVADFQSQRVYVVGEVGKPGIYPVNDIPMSILEAVNRAGGFTERSDRRNLTLTRQNISTHIDLLSLYEEGDASRNIRLEHGDVLFVVPFVEIGVVGGFYIHLHGADDAAFLKMGQDGSGHNHLIIESFEIS